MIEFSNPVEAQIIPELMAVRRAFPVSQQLLAGPVLREASTAARIGWHDTDVCAEMGAVAVVPDSGEFSSLVGDVIVVKRSTPTLMRGVFVYVVGSSTEIIDDISLGRRAFLALGLLSDEALTCSVGVIA
jgi:hypothetical protein